MNNHPLGLEIVGNHDRMRLLDELKRIAVEQLGNLPGELFAPIETKLQETIRLGAGLQTRTDLAALLALRARSAAFVMRYREVLARNFDDMRSRLGRDSRTAAMGLVEESDLAFHLAGQQLAESISQRYSRPLELLDQRFEALGVSLGAPNAANPVGALRLAGAFLQAFSGIDLSESLQQRLFAEYEHVLAQHLGDLYGKLNGLMAQNGLVAIHRDPAAAPAIPAQAQMQAPAANPPSDIEAFRAPAETRVEFQRLREMLHAWRGDAAGAPVPLPPGSREFQLDELAGIAATVQRDPVPDFVRSLAGDGRLGDAIRNHLLQTARGFGVDPERTRFSKREQDAIDLVGLLFTSLTRTHALPDGGRQLLSRLVIAYVRLAFQDELLFMRPDHPARRLLDALALSCESNDGSTPQDRALLQRAGELVARVIADYNEDLAVFAVAAGELEDLLQQQRSRAEVAERRAAEAMHGRERLQQARGQATQALETAIAGRPLTREVGGFLSEPWLHHAVQVLLRDGQQSSRHTQVVALARTLVALDSAAARGVGGPVATGLANLEDALVQCAQSSGLDPQLAQDWLAGFARAMAFPDAQRAAADMPAPAEDAAEDETPMLRLVGGNDTLAFDPVLAEKMRELAQGTWLRLVDDAGKEVSIRLAWISPLTGRRLLVDRRGLRQLVASPEQMAALAGEGRLVLNPAASPFDEAMRAMRKQLATAAA
ncbi:MAG TPA: DUF1631 family protein [Lysobacter sp.]|nr:DUF1631 family protein [Lysobacter sp.]